MVDRFTVGFHVVSDSGQDREPRIGMFTTCLLSSTQALHPSQVTRILLRAEPWTDGKGGAETEQHVTAMLEGVVRGQPVTSRSLPTLDLKLSSLAKVRNACTVH